MEAMAISKTVALQATVLMKGWEQSGRWESNPHLMLGKHTFYH
jgi:hypothetical protein